MRAPALGFLILLAGACSSSTVNPGSTGGTGGGGTDAGGGQAGTDAGSDAISSGGSAANPYRNTVAGKKTQNQAKASAARESPSTDPCGG